MITLNDIKNFKSTHNFEESIPLKSTMRFWYFFNNISTKNIFFNKVKNMVYNLVYPSKDLLEFPQYRYERAIKFSLRDYKNEII